MGRKARDEWCHIDSHVWGDVGEGGSSPVRGCRAISGSVDNSPIVVGVSVGVQSDLLFYRVYFQYNMMK